MSGTTFQISYGTTTVDTVYKTFIDSNIAVADAKVMAAQWLVDNVYTAGRRFAYSQPFPATDAGSQPAPFARGFTHADWLDGESTVQAGKTPTEDGFNDRFHKIEADLDRLGALTTQSFASLNAMRASLSRVLEEVRDELNRLNADVAQLKQQEGPITGGIFGPIYRAPKFLGKTKLLNQSAQLWEMEDGRIVSLPDAAQTATLPSNNLVLRAPDIAAILAVEPDIRAAFPEKVKAGDLVEKFGDKLSSDGRPLRDLLAAVPATQEFDNLDAVVNKITELDAALVKGMGGDLQLRQQFGIGEGPLGAAPLGKVHGIPPVLTQALEAEGVHTVQDMAAMDTNKLTAVAAAKGLALSSGDAQSLLVRMKTIRQL
jgi:hypothetical protein